MSIDDRLADRQGRDDAEAASKVKQAAASEMEKVQEKARQNFGESLQFGSVLEVLTPLAHEALITCLHGKDRTQVRAQGAYELVDKFLKAFGRRIEHVIVRELPAETRQPGSEEAEGSPPGPLA